jgi:hypothetical protein
MLLMWADRKSTGKSLGMIYLRKRSPASATVQPVGGSANPGASLAEPLRSIFWGPRAGSVTG